MGTKGSCSRLLSLASLQSRRTTVASACSCLWLLILLLGGDRGTVPPLWGCRPGQGVAPSSRPCRNDCVPFISTC